MIYDVDEIKILDLGLIIKEKNKHFSYGGTIGFIDTKVRQ